MQAPIWFRQVGPFKHRSIAYFVLTLRGLERVHELPPVQVVEMVRMWVSLNWVRATGTCVFRGRRYGPAREWLKQIRPQSD